MRAPAIVAHRGDSERFRENTLAAFRSAVEAGATRVELDVRTTADGKCVVLHDETLLRLWGMPRAAIDLTVAEIVALGHADVRVPQLHDVLDFLDDTGTGVLIDAIDADDAEVAWRVVQQQPQDDLEVHWCGPIPAMRRIRSLDPDARIHLAVERPFLEKHLIDELTPTHLNLEATLLSPELVAGARDLGLLLSVWTVDDPEDMAAVITAGVDAVTTNRPLLLKRLLAARVEAAEDTEPAEAAEAAVWAEPLDVGRPGHDEREALVAIDLARWAVGYISGTPVESRTTKAHSADFVTPVDLAVEDRVREVLAAEFPDDLIVGEERGGTSAPGRRTWWLDPVDGTTNLGSGLPWSSFALAFAEGTHLAVGVIADPWRREVVSARAGQGAWLGAQRCQARAETDPAGGIVLVELAAHAWWPGLTEFTATLATRHVTARIMGSGALSITSVGTGRALAAVIGDWNPIDHAAALLIALEAGAVAMTLDGKPTRWPGGGPFVVAAPGVADTLVADLRAAVAAARTRATV